jgi:DNA-binding MarR family transcriptional regulator
MPDGQPTNDRIVPTMEAWLAGGVDNFDVLLATAQLQQAVKVVDANLEAALRPHNITMPRLSILTRLFWADSDMALGEIATVLRLHPTSVTSAVDRLERDGLIQRIAHPTDRRATYASITTKGRALLNRIVPKLAADNFGMPGADRDLLRRMSLVLRDVREAAGDDVASEENYLSFLKRGDRARRAGQ